MRDATWRAAAEHLPWVVVLAPLIAAPLAVVCERAVRSHRANRRATRIRRMWGETTDMGAVGLVDSGREVTAQGTLFSGPGDRAETWRDTSADRLVDTSSSTAWHLALGHHRVALDGPLRIVVGAAETTVGPRTSRAGTLRSVRSGDEVRVRGRLIVEPAATGDAETYRHRELRLRLVPTRRRLLVAASASPRVTVRPGLVRAARITIALCLAFAVLPALTLLVLQWRTLRAGLLEQEHCERDLAAAIEHQRHGDAARLAAQCGSLAKTAELEWLNAEMRRASHHYRQRRDDDASFDIHASNAASQIIAGAYDEAARVVHRLSTQPGGRPAWQCLAAGLWLMHEPAPWAEEWLRNGAEAELMQVRSIGDDTPITCVPLLADVVGDTAPLEQLVAYTREHGIDTGHHNRYLAAMLLADRRGRIDPAFAAETIDDPRSLASVRTLVLDHPIALSNAVLRSLDPSSSPRVSAALAAHKALFDAYMGEASQAMASLAPVLRFAKMPRGPADGHVFVVGATAALLAREPGTAETLLDESHERSALVDAPLGADGAPLCATCGLSPLVEHLATRRRIAGDHPAAVAAASRAHAALLRRDIAVPLHLLHRLGEMDRRL